MILHIGLVYTALKIPKIIIAVGDGFRVCAGIHFSRDEHIARFARIVFRIGRSLAERNHRRIPIARFKCGTALSESGLPFTGCGKKRRRAKNESGSCGCKTFYARNHTHSKSNSPLKNAEPDTTISAPAPMTRGAVVLLTPPSTEISNERFFSFLIAASSSIL